ncbi:hypothetical protein [Clostridium tertium]|nr:hypothetical protein [Clostridium tertium]MDI9218755.1 hypothetical protein [Clostridium tertium]
MLRQYCTENNIIKNKFYYNKKVFYVDTVGSAINLALGYIMPLSAIG